MLVDTVPYSMVEDYQHSLRDIVPGWLQKFFLSRETLSSAEMVKVMEFASSTHRFDFMEYSNLFGDKTSICKPFIESSTGIQVPGFFSMHNDFVNFSVNTGAFKIPVGNGYSKMTVTGVADNLAEIQSHVKLLVNDVENSYVYLGLVNKDFVVRISEYNNPSDFLVFNNLYHVGEWGKNLRKTSEFAKTMDHKKFDRLVRRNGVNGEDARLMGIYHKLNQGLQGRYDNLAFSDSRKHESGDYFKAYENYKETHQSFLIFEILVINSEL